MSDPRIKGPISAVVLPVSDSLQQLGTSPPFQKHVSLACTGAILLSLCAFAALVFGRDVATFSTETLLGFAAVVGFSLLLLVVGMRGARGPRDPTMAISSLATPAGVAAVLWWLGGPEIFSNGFVIALGPAFRSGSRCASGSPCAGRAAARNAWCASTSSKTASSGAALAANDGPTRCRQSPSASPGTPRPVRRSAPLSTIKTAM